MCVCVIRFFHVFGGVMGEGEGGLCSFVDMCVRVCVSLAWIR